MKKGLSPYPLTNLEEGEGLDCAPQANGHEPQANVSLKKKKAQGIPGHQVHLARFMLE